MVFIKLSEKDRGWENKELLEIWEVGIEKGGCGYWYVELIGNREEGF